MSLPYVDENELMRVFSPSTARAIARVVNEGELVTQYGSGSPIGVVKANKSGKYIDIDTNTEYYNPDFGDDTNWTAL